MAFPGEICKHFNSHIFRFYLRKKYKRVETFAKRIGVSISTVYRWKSGEVKPTWRHLIQISNIFNVSPQLLLIKSKRHILNKWEDHLIDYLEAPPEIKHETRVTLINEDGSSETTKDVKRELKLTTKEAIEVSEKLGYFEGIENERGDEQETEQPDESTKKLHELVDDEP